MDPNSLGRNAQNMVDEIQNSEVAERARFSLEHSKAGAQHIATRGKLESAVDWHAPVKVLTLRPTVRQTTCRHGLSRPCFGRPRRALRLRSWQAR